MYLRAKMSHALTTKTFRLCTTHLQVKATRKRRRTEAPAHKDLVNKTPPYALHVFRIMTQERQRLKFKPNIKKRPLEHLKWVLKRERLEKNPVYPSGNCSKSVGRQTYDIFSLKYFRASFEKWWLQTKSGTLHARRIIRYIYYTILS